MTSIFQLFTIGIGPSSSHSVGPMRAANRFLQTLEDAGVFARVARVRVHLYGSLALTGRGHGTDRAIEMGLAGATPETVDPDMIAAGVAQIMRTSRLRLAGRQSIVFEPDRDLVFHPDQRLPRHSNGMRFVALDADTEQLLERIYYSIGGGFVIEDGLASDSEERELRVPYPFASADQLVALGRREGLRISDIVLENERVWRTEAQIRQRLEQIWQVMQSCVAKGCRTHGTLPGGLQLERRAPQLFTELNQNPEASLRDPLSIVDWVNMYALAVAEENAAGGRVVTAPTNGAAGIIPAVLHYYDRFCPTADQEGVLRFLLTAGAIGLLYKKHASISGAEVGCQGEVGVACSMAAGALAEVLGGNVDQVEQAAEIGMEHNLGLTCDPVGGLVQVPCIERNAMGAIKAINAARLALRSDGHHKVSLDRIIQVMRSTGADMSDKYKETARGGLAVNVPAC